MPCPPSLAHDNTALETAPDAATIAVAIMIADIVHELRRAQARPVSRIWRGPVAASQAGAVAFGWLQPAAAEARLLVLTPAGRRALADAGKRDG